MPQLEARRGRREAASRGPGFLLPIAVLAVVLCAAAAVVFFILKSQVRYDPPVIQGVRETITAYEDDIIQNILLEGVTAVGGEDRPDQTFPVQVQVYDEAGALVEAEDIRPGAYRLVYLCEEGRESLPLAESTLTVLPADTEPPVIQGTEDKFVELGGTVSYRDGVTVTDNMDPSVQLQIDANQVNLNEPGLYQVVYSAKDARGNEASVTAVVTVFEPAAEETPEGETAGGGTETSGEITRESLDELGRKILGQITNTGMSQRQKAKAIFDYVHSHIKYVGTSDKSSWVTGAYIGLTRGRGDCFNYYACSKELLTLAGISNIDLYRVGGTTDHYWQLVNTGDGWYHFDACPHPNSYPITSFMLTEAEVRAYTDRCSSVRKNYYVYNYDNCPVTVVGTPAAEIPAQTAPAEEPAPEQTPAEPPESAPEIQQPAAQTQQPAAQSQQPAAPAAPEAPEEPVPEAPAPEETAPAESQPADEVIVPPPEDLPGQDAGGETGGETGL